ncbi:MAG: hypothetical protein IJU25_00150 [Lachnospiraceae bacterium]|nr:hypothetical protein [Lachnospiraceae bacterium]
MKNKTSRGLLASFIFVFLAFFMTVKAEAKPLDEILNYTIMVEVNQDATLNMKYHVDWKVLDSDSEGPLTWIQIGAPNKNYVTNLEALSDNIKTIKLDGSKFRIDLDREYLEGETVSFDFAFTQDYLYQVNKYKDGYTVYSYTPGWFDGIEVDELVILWNDREIDNYTPAADQQDGWVVWTASLNEGEKFKIEVAYPNDAYGFDLSHTEEEDDGDPWYITVIAIVVILVAGALIIGTGIGFYVLLIYAASAGFSLLGYGLNALSGKNKQITRTKIEYYDACPGCGGVREEGKDVCSFCGKSMIKSQETITEKQLKNEYKDAKQYTQDGDYRYGSSGNQFIRVNTVPITLGAYMRAQAKNSSRRSSGSSHHSSCAHSSCACACACACAGGGRAGCTGKDFYRTDLKPHYFKS